MGYTYPKIIYLSKIKIYWSSSFQTQVKYHLLQEAHPDPLINVTTTC